MKGSFRISFINGYGLTAFLLCSLLIGCSKDDDGGGSDNFYSGALKSATLSNLEGSWSIVEAETKGVKVEIPPSTSECGRDFFNFSADYRYTEFVFNSSICTPESNTLGVELNDGVITLSNQLGQNEELVIIELTLERLSFKARTDIDGDGTLEILIFYAIKYSPPAESDIYSATFIHNNILDYQDRIQLNWFPYSGYNEFSRYEIYRSAGDCDKSEAVLIATLETPETDVFIDEDPAVSENLCYYFRVYTDKGLLGESEMVSVDTGDVNVSSVTVSEPSIVEGSISLGWTQYSGRYFSHYEITVRNHSGGTGSGFQELTVKTIDDINTLDYTDTDPPYFWNPVYTVYVVDIFGNKSPGRIEGEHSWPTNFKRKEVVGLDYISKLAIDPSETIVYLYGSQPGDQLPTIIRYNYATYTIEAVSDFPPSSHTDMDMKVIASEEGKEVLFAQGNSFNVYDAATLDFKYELRTVNQNPSFSDLVYLRNDLWVYTDSGQVYTCIRNGKDLNIVDSGSHFVEHQPYFNYQLIVLGSDHVLVGHSEEPGSFRFTIDPTGVLTERVSIPIPILSDWKKETFYNANHNYLINLVEGRLYSLSDHSVLGEIVEPAVLYGISADGNKIFGSGNDPEDIDLLEIQHDKKAYVYDWTTQTIDEYATKGYPHFIFENHLGQKISVSSGLLRQTIDRRMPSPDLFFERIE